MNFLTVQARKCGCAHAATIYTRRARTINPNNRSCSGACSLGPESNPIPLVTKTRSLARQARPRNSVNGPSNPERSVDFGEGSARYVKPGRLAPARQLSVGKDQRRGFVARGHAVALDALGPVEKHPVGGSPSRERFAEIRFVGHYRLCLPDAHAKAKRVDRAPVVALYFGPFRVTGLEPVVADGHDAAGEPDRQR